MKLNRRELLAGALLLPGQVRAADRRQVIRERASLLSGYPGQQLPKVDLALARQIAEGTVFFNKRIPVKTGLRNIDWSGGHLKHQEWPAQLNRFFHLAPLASAYAATKEELYAQAAKAYLEDWMQGDPYPNTSKRRAGDSALTMSIRLGNSESPGWTGNLTAFLDSPAFDDQFLDHLLQSIRGQASFAAGHLAVGPNWYISQLDALVFVSLRLPFLDGASEWLQTGVSRLREEMSRQFLDDGVHIERTPAYHNWMTTVAVNYFDLARKFPEADAGVNPARVAKSLDYSAQSELSGLNDTALPGSNAQEKYLSVRSRSRSVLGLQDESAPLDQVFRAAGHVFSRTSWEKKADYLAFDAGSWGSTHCHLSRLSFTFRKNGRVIVADPGILSYEMSDPLGPYGKSTAAHSTVSLDGWNQSSADARLLYTQLTKDTAVMQAVYQGGWWKGTYGWGFTEGHGEGIWGEQERTLFWVKGEYLLIVDHVSADAGHRIQNGYQLCPGPWSVDKNALRWSAADMEVRLVVAPKGTVVECFEGQKTPPRGWIGFAG